MSITGSSVKAEGPLGNIGPAQATDGSAPVYLLTVENPDGRDDLTINGRSWPPYCHTGDSRLFAYAPGAVASVTVGGVTNTFAFDPDSRTFVLSGGEQGPSEGKDLDRAGKFC